MQNEFRSVIFMQASLKSSSRKVFFSLKDHIFKNGFLIETCT